MNKCREFELLEKIFMAGLRRVDPLAMMNSQLKVNKDKLLIKTETENHTIDLSQFRRILVTGMGKASARMALGLEQILGERINSGIIAVKYGHTENLKHIKLIEAGHPVPDSNSIIAAKEITDFLNNADSDDLIINLISGGGSSVLCSPSTFTGGRSITLEDKQAVSRILLSCGADIHEINCIRKHLSSVKGGRLAELMYPARSVNLILSDVVGDNLDAIASGATVPDSTSFIDAMTIITKYNISYKLPHNIIQHIKDGLEGNIPDTPKPGSNVFTTTTNVLIGTNRHALTAAAAEATRLGCKTEILTSVLTGEAREIAHFFSAIGRETEDWKRENESPRCFIAGGETTVTLLGNGLGGRNQEMALSFLNDIGKLKDKGGKIFFLSAGTDGNDGPTDAAGAFASSLLYKIGKEQGLDPGKYISESDSYHFFEKIKSLFKTGPTGTNVCDIQILLVI